jgi:hypothetical protein
MGMRQEVISARRNAEKADKAQIFPAGKAVTRRHLRPHKRTEVGIGKNGCFDAQRTTTRMGQ